MHVLCTFFFLTDSLFLVNYSYLTHILHEISYILNQIELFVYNIMIMGISVFFPVMNIWN